MERSLLLTIAAIRDYMSIGLFEGPPSETNPEFRAARDELTAICTSTPMRRTVARTTRAPVGIYRTGRIRVGKRERSVRLELTVTDEPVAKLLRVTAKTEKTRSERRRRSESRS